MSIVCARVAQVGLRLWRWDRPCRLVCQKPISSCWFLQYGRSLL